ncbi:Fungal specific transcription factor domain [Ceratobasidium sp. AG-Ba]|nr:Fungal specific transcription factor domain [Ceratobasidium sp. AG-Ba]
MILWSTATTPGHLDNPDPDEQEAIYGNVLTTQFNQTLPANLSLFEFSLPPRFVPDPRLSGQTIRFIMSQYEQLFELMFFRPARPHMECLRGKFVQRIISSNLIHCSSYLGAQLLQALRQDRDYLELERFSPWFERLDRLCLTWNRVSLEDLKERLATSLELAFLRYISSNVKSGYALLRRMAPVFMQVACADPTLWPRDPSSNGISLAHALVPPRHEIDRFIFMDNISSLTFGVPLLVEYDTSHPMIETTAANPIEWIHGCPNRVMFSIVKINQWRMRHPNGCLEGEYVPWKEIEKDAWAWNPPPVGDFETDSSRHVARVAVQEGWRHALLIYLYMGMCGVTSHDPRVQTSVRQISRLYSVIKSQLASGMHLMAPVLLAAICTRSEVDRAKFRDLVSHSGKDKRAAANGEPVVWDDYIASRKVMIDLGV